MESRDNGVQTEVPIRENLFVVPSLPGEGPRLIGSRCGNCGGTFFPQEKMCPACVKEGTMEIVSLNGRGKLISFTQVMRGLPGFDSPYVLGCIELEEGPTLIAQLQDWQEVVLETNMPVELVIGKIKKDGKGNTVVGPKFKPLVK
jgi:uncharacterized OB-fold protein